MREAPVAIRFLTFLALILLLSPRGLSQDVVQRKDSVFIIGQDSLLTKGQDTLLTENEEALPDTARPVRVKPEVPVQPLLPASDFITAGEILFLNNRSAAEILGARWGTVLHSFGTPVLNSFISAGGGLPAQTVFLSNGFEMNDNSTTGFDLPVVLHEEIDSLEYISLTRSFLFGSENPSAAFNIIRRGRVSPLPFSKIRYYEGPYGEGMIDVQFNKLFYNSVNVTVDVMNRKNDDRFKNSSGSIWSGRASAEYLFSEKWNAGVSYYYAKSNVNNNMGVNVDSVKSYALNWETQLYDEIAAPVNDYYLYEKITRKQIEAVLRAKLLPALYTTVHLYSKSYLREHRNEVITNIPSASMDFIDKRMGVLVRQEAVLGIATARLSWQYEDAARKAENFRGDPAIRRVLYPYDSEEKWNIFTGELSIELIKGLRAGAFGKINTDGLKNKQGFGADLEYLSDRLSIYAGFSRYRQSSPLQGFSPTLIDRSIAELRTVWRDDSFVLRANVYMLSNKFEQNLVVPLLSGVNVAASDFLGETVTGAGLSGWMKQGIILTEASVSFNNSSTAIVFEPPFDGKVGIYYNDTLFDSSLVLKTGFEVKYRSSYRGRFNAPFYGNFIFAPVDNPSVYTLDFFTSGKVGENATVFFLWENLLNEEYYQMYLYPMPARGVVFGINWEMFN